MTSDFSDAAWFREWYIENNAGGLDGVFVTIANPNPREAFEEAVESIDLVEWGASANYDSSYFDVRLFDDWNEYPVNRNLDTWVSTKPTEYTLPVSFTSTDGQATLKGVATMSKDIKKNWMSGQRYGDLPAWRITFNLSLSSKAMAAEISSPNREGQSYGFEQLSAESLNSRNAETTYMADYGNCAWEEDGKVNRTCTYRFTGLVQGEDQAEDAGDGTVQMQFLNVRFACRDCGREITVWFDDVIPYDIIDAGKYDDIKEFADFYNAEMFEAESVTKNAVGVIIRDGDPSSPPSDIFLTESGHGVKKAAYPLKGDKGQQIYLELLDPIDDSPAHRRTAKFLRANPPQCAGHLAMMRNNEPSCCGGTSEEELVIIDWLADNRLPYPGSIWNPTCLNSTSGVTTWTIMNAKGGESFRAEVCPCGCAMKGCVCSSSCKGECLGAESFSFGAEECTTDWECYTCERCKAHCDCGINKMERRKSMSKVYGDGLESAEMCGDTLCKGAESVTKNAERGYVADWKEDTKGSYKVVPNRFWRNLGFGVGLLVSSVLFLSTAGQTVSDWAKGVVQKYVPAGMLSNQFKPIFATVGLIGISYFGYRLIWANVGAGTVRPGFGPLLPLVEAVA